MSREAECRTRRYARSGSNHLLIHAHGRDEGPSSAFVSAVLCFFLYTCFLKTGLASPRVSPC